MMTGRAWFPGSELAGVVTAMITYKGRARALTRQSPVRHLIPRHPKDFADSLPHRQLVTKHEHRIGGQPSPRATGDLEWSVSIKFSSATAPEARGFSLIRKWLGRYAAECGFTDRS